MCVCVCVYKLKHTETNFEILQRGIKSEEKRISLTNDLCAMFAEHMRTRSDALTQTQVAAADHFVDLIQYSGHARQ